MKLWKKIHIVASVAAAGALGWKVLKNIKTDNNKNSETKRDN